ncbi:MULTISPECIES: polysaccharide deacetylase family protein [unclassified Mycobacterium]|uniref:polysaccharide deacetylase family protein n=1 Tax=unclassified Mycobacterium TaxID=2642494 RepID=UPI0009E9B9DE|nr:MULTISPECIES: polysaccharide deacetylase family protein [unclassified Mycobacterium]
MRPRISLTFDNGPTPGVTDQVLDALAERGMSAIFFVVGENVSSPAGHRLLERVVRDGHRIGNHSLTHGRPLGELSAAETLHEIRSTQKILDGFGNGDRYFRPWGTEGALERRCLNLTAIEYLLTENYTCVLWNSVPRDWADPTGWVDRALADTQSQLHTVVVLHDLPTGAMEQLPRFLDGLGGVDVTTDLPDDCVPIVGGEMRAAIDHLTPAIG